MDNTYAIIWAAPQGGKSGIGTRRFSRDEAEALANELNEEHGGFMHRAIDVANDDPALVLTAMRSTTAPDSVAAEATAIVSTELAPKIEERLVWLKDSSEISPVDASAA